MIMVTLVVEVKLIFCLTYPSLISQLANCSPSTPTTTSLMRWASTNRLAVAQVNTPNHKGCPFSFQPLSLAYTSSASRTACSICSCTTGSSARPASWMHWLMVACLLPRCAAARRTRAVLRGLVEPITHLFQVSEQLQR